MPLTNLGRKKRPTIRDVAKLAGVNHVTVSRAINDSSLVSDAARQRVLDACAKLDFRPNLHARALKGAKTMLAGAIIPDINNPVNMGFVSGIEQMLETAGYHLLIASSERSEVEEIGAVRRLVEMMADGLIVLPVCARASVWRPLIEDRFPLVFISRRVPEAQADMVVPDNFAGAVAAVEFLAGKGHTRIAFVGASHAGTTHSERLAGYRAGLEAAGLPFTEVLFVDTTLTIEGGEAAAGRLLELREPPTAVFACNDVLAFGILRRLEAEGVRVPDDMALVGFDDLIFSGFVNPPLTTIRQDPEALGAEAGRMLLERIRNPDTPPRAIVMPVELVARRSA